MTPEFDLTKIVEEIAMQAKETQEEFIFETTHPYCENILQMKINKKELKQILLNGVQKQQYCEDVLEKIRAEIEQIADEEQKYDEKWAIGLRYAVKIIDKYKAESEVSNEN